ncbi:MAG: potassium channel family protein [Geminicoccaceae bacterium]
MADLVLPAPVASRRFSVLLGGLFALLLIAPLFGESARGQGELGVLFSFLIIGFVIAAQRRKRVVAGIALLWLAATWAVPTGEIVSDLLLLLLCLLTIESLLVHVARARTVDTEVLAAAIGAYLLIGIGWAVGYTMLETIVPGSFHLSETEAAAPWNPLLYFSFATLTTVGYGDLTPASLTARAWAAVEAVGGTLYLAILIARLVSLYRSTETASP